MAETWTLQNCRPSGITLGFLVSCLGESQSVDFVVTDCLPLSLELGHYTYRITSRIRLINWHRITGYLATVLGQDWDYENRVGPHPESDEALAQPLTVTKRMSYWTQTGFKHIFWFCCYITEETL